jgi:histidinol-phosphatase (PHP family)
MYYDYHVHTNCSADGAMGLDQACRAALHKGVVEMAVTDHLDIDYPDRSIDFELDYQAYTQAVNNAKQLYDGKLNIIKGIEIGLQPHVLDRCRSYLEDKDFEFVIASVHAADRKDLHSGEFCAGKSRKTAYMEYLEEVYRCIQGFQLFNVIGHIDLIRRYGNYSSHTLCYSDYADILDMIMISLIDRGKGIEINTSGYR